MPTDSRVKALEWLETHRQLACPNDSINIPMSPQDALLEALPEKDRVKAKEIWEARQGTSLYALLDSDMAKYEERLSHVLTAPEFRTAQSVLFAYHPTYSFDAYADTLPSGHPLALVHFGVPYVLNIVSHWYVASSRAGFSLFAGPTGLLGLATQILSTWLGHSGDADPQRMANTEDEWILKDLLTDSSILFVLAHELGHHHLKHLGYTDDIKKNHAMEFEADAFAFQIILRHALLQGSRPNADSWHVKHAMFAPLFTMGVISLLSDSESVTHPSVSARAEKMLQNFVPTLDTIAKGGASKVLDFIDHDFPQMMRRNWQGLYSLLAPIGHAMQPTLGGVAGLHSNFRSSIHES